MHIMTYTGTTVVQIYSKFETLDLHIYVIHVPPGGYAGKSC